MIYIIIGAVGFTVVHIFDFVSLKRIRGLKPVTWGAGSGLLIYSMARLCLSPEKLVLPSWLTVVGWVVLVFSAPLLIHALFIQLPFRKTYVSDGVGDELITSGSYALVRHPGVIWFTMFMLSLIPVARSTILLVAAPVFIAIDILLVYLQDKFIFGRMFDDYYKYRQKTPMLVPNRKSFGDFLHSIKHSKVVETKEVSTNE